MATTAPATASASASATAAPGPGSGPGSALGSALGPAPPSVPADWPYRAHSHMVQAGGLRWHVQLLGRPAGTAPVLLLLHGTGASTHTWRGLLPYLLPHFTVLAPDLPGHASTTRPAAAEGLSLAGMATSLGALLQVLQLQPQVVVGHSAGAAIAARLCLDGAAAPHALFSVNGAWLPPQGAAGWWYAPMARLLAANPVAPHLFAWQAARPAVLRRLIEGTGSHIDAVGLDHYRRLAANPAHVGAVIAMMAAWQLPPLLQELHRLQPTLHLLVGEADRAVPPAVAQAVLQRLLVDKATAAHLHRLPQLGHLAHEEAPAVVAKLVLEYSCTP
jgi:magnesium chelatase accessory protein